MAHPPRTHPRATVEAEDPPRPPQRLEALDGFGVIPPLRAPLEGALDLAFEVRAQPARYPSRAVGIGRFRLPDRAILSFGSIRSHSGLLLQLIGLTGLNERD